MDPSPRDRVLSALGSGPVVRVDVPSLVDLALLDSLDQAYDVLASLDSDGLIDVAEGPEGFSVTLSPAGAELAGLVVGELDGVPIWWSSTEELPPLREHRERGVIGGDFDLDRIAIRPPGLPDFEDLPGEKVSPMAKPRVIVGLGLSPHWEKVGAVNCPGCKGRPRKHEYCVICSRWGRDHEIAAEDADPGRAEELDRQRINDAMRADRLRKRRASQRRRAIETNGRNRQRPVGNGQGADGPDTKRAV